jgi:hypothetical protein
MNKSKLNYILNIWIELAQCIVTDEDLKYSRASNKPEKPGVIPSKRDDTSPTSPHRPVKKLEGNRRLMLEQQLGENQQPINSPLIEVLVFCFSL